MAAAGISVSMACGVITERNSSNQRKNKSISNTIICKAINNVATNGNIQWLMKANENENNGWQWRRGGSRKASAASLKMKSESVAKSNINIETLMKIKAS
jgi:hypothetical protein